MRILPISSACFLGGYRQIWKLNSNLCSSGGETPRTSMCLIFTRHQLVLLQISNSRGVTRITEEPLYVLSWICFHPTETMIRISVISPSYSPLQDQSPRPFLTMTDHKLCDTNSLWYHSPKETLYNSMTAHIFNKAGPHHPQEPHHHQESPVDCARIHRKPSKIWASRIAFSPD